MTESLLQEVSTNTGIPVKELRPLWNESKQEANRLSHRPGSTHWTQTAFTLFKSKAAALAASRTEDTPPVEEPLEEYSNDEPDPLPETEDSPAAPEGEDSPKKARKSK